MHQTCTGFLGVFVECSKFIPIYSLDPRGTVLSPAAVDLQQRNWRSSMRANPHAIRKQLAIEEVFRTITRIILSWK